MMPFLCLIGGAVIATWLVRLPRIRLATSIVVLCVATQAAFNFRVPLRQEFPAEFIARISRAYPDGYREVASAPHPLEFLPYQYEGHIDSERRLFRSSDIRMRAFVPSR